ncbi:hydrogenase formation protein HypD [candidate division KSB1 bacterium]|nr:hydrogenase formation protein HypD [candidate division KSB1 bacterium]
MNLKHLSEYRGKEVCQKFVEKIYMAKCGYIRLMEVCGTHTMAIARSGIRQLLPQNITLLSGPGCPVCVTSQREIDQFIKLAGIENAIIVTFGDLLRVPGSASSLQNERAKGADVRVVYSPMDCLEIAEKHPEKEAVFLGVGFETTAPTIAAAVIEAQRRKVSNFSVISAHKLVPPALSALLNNPKIRVDGFICPGHVSVIIGARAYAPVVDIYRKPCVVAGFEPADILQGIFLLVEQIENAAPAVAIAYARGVQFEGNKKARDILSQVFESCDAEWRGIGVIPDSGLKFRDAYRNYDAQLKFDLHVDAVEEPKGCACGEILCGTKTPFECPLFRTKCTPEHPIGPCMVSSEGTCAAYFKYL